MTVLVKASSTLSPRCSSTARSRSAYIRCRHSSLRTIEQAVAHREAWRPPAASPARRSGSVSPASSVVVRSSTTRRTSAIASCRSAERLVERAAARRGRCGTPWSRSSGPTAATAGATGRGRRAWPARPRTRWRRPGGAGSGRTTTRRRPTRAAARAAAGARGRRSPTSSRSLTSHASRNPSGRRRPELRPVRVAPVELGLDQRCHVDPVEHQVLELAVDAGVLRSRRRASSPRSCRSRRMVEPLNSTSLNVDPLQVRPLVRRSGQVLEAFDHGVRLGGSADVSASGCAATVADLRGNRSASRRYRPGSQSDPRLTGPSLATLRSPAA